MLNGPFAEIDRCAKGEKTDKGKAKESESQKGPKQTTLFDLSAAASDSSVKKSSGPTKSEKATGTENETQETQDGTTESHATTTCDVQGDGEMEETQVLDQLPAEPQEMNDNDEEPIEWPDSPPPQSEVD